jgi:FkbM family methyltransferase
MTLKSTFKRLRASQPFNRVATSTLKQVFEVTSWHPEFAVKHLPRVGITNISLPDDQLVKLDSSGEDWIPTQLFWHGWLGYEREVTETFYSLARKSDVILDVGAHIGFFSVLAATVNRHSNVYAFEPLPRVYERLKRNVALNQLRNIQTFCAAVGERNGEQEFYFPNEDAPVSSSLRSDMLLATLGEEVVQHVRVPVTTLDSVVESHKLEKVDLIKLDTERTEHDVLAGGTQILKRFQPHIICEVWPDANNIQQLENLLRPHGYLFYQLMPDGPVKRLRIEPSVEALNYLFTVKALG